ncbi:MAG: chemotaxis protein CheB, partial [Pseudomonadota bacterium]
MGETSSELESAHTPALNFPIVGIGASAGGLEAVTSMFHKLDVGTGMAFVLVLHLDPNHESLMAELLSRKTHIDVRQIRDGDEIEVDCLHVIPPGFGLSLEDGCFRLEPFAEPRGLRRPIDSFFASLAETQGEKAACVVVSGTGADGTAGLRIIKEMGGVCAVQSPEEARYDGMPFSALSTKLADFTLPADQIIPRLKLFFDGTFRPDLSDAVDKFLLEVFSTLRENSGHDFSGY